MSYSYIKNVFPNFEYSTVSNENFNVIETAHPQVPEPYETKLFASKTEPKSEPIEVAKTRLEDFNNISENYGCEYVMDHVSKCDKCYKMTLKQMTFENDRIQKEELMELASYIAFGIFVLLLVDYLKKN